MPQVSAQDLARVAHASRVLLSPLEDGWTAAGWRAAAHDALTALLGAGAANVHLPVGTDGAWYAPALSDAAVAEYHADFAAQDLVCGRVVSRGLRVAHEWMVTTPDELEGSAFFQEWVRPHWAFADTLALHAPLPGGPGALVTLSCRPAARAGRRSGGRRGDGATTARRLALLQAVWPAFESGATMAGRRARAHAPLAALADGLDEPLAVCDADGRRSLHENAALARLLAAAAASAPLVRAAIGRVARGAAAHCRPTRGAAASAAPAPREVLQAGAVRYVVRAVVAGRDVLAVPGVLVGVTRELPDPLAEATLRARFGLTPRQAAVARLLADGMDNEALSARLGVTSHTGRRHTEQVLLKLGVRTRAQVAAVLRGAGRRPHASA